MDIVESARNKISQLDQLRITGVDSAGALLNLFHTVQTRNLEIRGTNDFFHEAYQLLTDCRTLSFHTTNGNCHLSDVIRTILENQNLTALSVTFLGLFVGDVVPSQLDDITLELSKLLQLNLKSSPLMWGGAARCNYAITGQLEPVRVRDHRLPLGEFLDPIPHYIIDGPHNIPLSRLPSPGHLPLTGITLTSYCYF